MQGDKIMLNNTNNIQIDDGNPILSFWKNYARMAIVTHAFCPKNNEFWICLDSPGGILGYFKYQIPCNIDFQKSNTKTDCFGYAQLVGVYPAHVPVPDSADVHRLLLSTVPRSN